MTDADYLLEQLRLHPSGRDAMQVISASIRDRGVGLTVHSRAASLRADGYVISCAIEGKTRKGRERYVYRLVSEPQECEPRMPVYDGAGVRAAHESTPPLEDAGAVEPPARVGQAPQPLIPQAVALPDAAIPVAALAPITVEQLERDDMRHPAGCGCGICREPALVEIEGQLVLIP